MKVFCVEGGVNYLVLVFILNTKERRVHRGRGFMREGMYCVKTQWKAGQGLVQGTRYYTAAFKRRKISGAFLSL